MARGAPWAAFRLKANSHRSRHRIDHAFTPTARSIARNIIDQLYCDIASDMRRRYLMIDNADAAALTVYAVAKRMYCILPRRFMLY